MLRINEKRNTSMNLLLIFLLLWILLKWLVCCHKKRCSVSREHKLPAQSYSGFYNCVPWKVTIPAKNCTLLKAEWSKCWSEYLSLIIHVKVEITEDMIMLSAGSLAWACFTLEPTFVSQNYWTWTTKSSCVVCEKADKNWKAEWWNCTFSFKSFSL